MGRAVGAGRNVADIDAARREEPGEAVQDTGLVEADDVDRVVDGIGRGGLTSVRLALMVMPEASPSFCSSPSSLASVCQLPETSSSIANSLPSAAIRLSSTLPPQSTTTRVRS
jgi:hypothetical protein